ncbi:hypothetical protein scyTo_0001083 [Scyliorhinus torazame]|uniref:Uncharacterized protein n=1 Tax=Scyliorhinus torazame TaxID=75743 RepID=A0A401P8Z3_SCYTO|nr:hypothetical protein [Scyliorhinus torazame]
MKVYDLKKVMTSIITPVSLIILCLLCGPDLHDKLKIPIGNLLLHRLQRRESSGFHILPKTASKQRLQSIFLESKREKVGLLDKL